MKAVLKISCFILLLFFALCTAFLLLLRTSQSTWLTQQIVQGFAPNTVQLSDAKFHFPNQFTLKQITLGEQTESALSIDSTTVTLQLVWSLTRPLKISNVVISGINLPHGLPDKDQVVQLVNKWQPQRLEIHSLDFASQQLIARDAHLIYEPKADFPLGLIKVSSEQLYWNGEALNQFNATVNITESTTQIDHMGFDWRGGSIQLMAEQNANKAWILNDILVRNLHLDEKDFSQKVATQLASIGLKIDRIEHAELMQFSWQQSGLELNQSHLEINNWHRDNNFWQQNASLSLIAESVIWNELRFLEPKITLNFEPSKIHIDQFQLLFEQGQILAKGELTRQSLHLNSLNITNLEWNIDEIADSNKLWSELQRLQDLSIDEVEIKRSQIIYLGAEHHWQFSGLNAEGENLHLRKGLNWGLWNGAIAASANSISALGMTSIKPYIEMATQDHKWQLKQLFLPIPEGLIEASSEMDLSVPSNPWNVQMTAYGLPLQSITDQLDLAIDWQGLADVDLNLSGLGGDELMLRHSLTGEATISPHAVELQLPFTKPMSKTMIIPPVTVIAQRGVINVPEITFIGSEISGRIEGLMDLVEPNSDRINLNLETECFSLKATLPNGRNQLYLDCL